MGNFAGELFSKQGHLGAALVGGDEALRFTHAMRIEVCGVDLSDSVSGQCLWSPAQRDSCHREKEGRGGRGSSPFSKLLTRFR